MGTVRPSDKKEVMVERLLIIGAGGFGREILGWALDIQPTQQGWEIAGFLDLKPDALSGYSIPFKNFGDPTNYTPNANDRFVCAIADPAQKLQTCRELKRRGAQFVSLIHPSAVVGPNCTIGEGCLLCPGAVLTTNVKLGDFVALNVQATAGHDVIIGDGCTLNAHSDVTGCAQLGEGVFLRQSCIGAAECSCRRICNCWCRERRFAEGKSACHGHGRSR